MAIEWYDMYYGSTNIVSVGVDWNVTANTNTSYSIAPLIYRWDTQSTDNYGSKYSETLSPDPSGAGYWSGLSWGSGSGTRKIDTFATRTYTKTTSTQTVTMKLSWDSSFGSYYSGAFRSLGSGSHTWTLTIPALSTVTVTFNDNGGSGGPGSQSFYYDVSKALSSTKPTRTGFEFLGWSTSSTATSASYSSGSSYSFTSNTTLYAVWKATVPGAPSGITISRSGSSVTLGWTNNPSAAGLTGTKIYEDKNGTVGSTNLNSTTSSTQTSATITGLSSNSRYRYKLVAYNAQGDSSAAYSDYVYTAPAAPSTGYGMNNNGAVSLGATVSNIKYASSYQWQRSQDQSTWTTISLTAATGSDSHSLTGNVYYRVRAVAPDGTVGSWYTFLCGNRVNLYFWIPG